MVTIYEFPGGAPRFYLDSDAGAELLKDLLLGQHSEPAKTTTIHELGTGRAVFFIQGRTIFAMDGTPTFWISEDIRDVYLHPVDTTQSPRFYFDLFDREPGAPAPEEQPPWHGLMDRQVRTVGRRAAISAWTEWDNAKKR